VVQNIAGHGFATAVESDQPKDFSNGWNNKTVSYRSSFLPNVEAASSLINTSDHVMPGSIDRDANQFTQSMQTAYDSTLNHTSHRLQNQKPIPGSLASFSPTPSAPSLQHWTSPHAPLGLPPMLLPSALDGIALPPLRLFERRHADAVQDSSANITDGGASSCVMRRRLAGPGFELAGRH
jgi:hypothetical protein